MTVQVVELQRGSERKFYFILPAEFTATALMFEQINDPELQANVICMTHSKERADEIAAALNRPPPVEDIDAGILSEEGVRKRLGYGLTFEDRVSGSAYVSAVSYLADKRVLEIVFRANPNFVYAYEDFPPEKWSELQAAKSAGSYIARAVVGPTGKNRPPVPPFKYTKRAVAHG